jgi:outer membrane protein TolC
MMRARASRVLCALACSLFLPAAFAAGGKALAGDLLYGLPPEVAVRSALSNLPALRISGLNRELAGAERDRLAAGNGEWIVRAGAAQRRILDQERYREQEVLVERSVRWFGKAAQDRAIGARGMALADAARADAWHEAARVLMRDWYDLLRAEVAVDLLRQQQGVLQEVVAVTARRVKAGDAARLDLMQAETEAGRAAAQLEQAELQLRKAKSVLVTSYPGLPLTSARRIDELPLPQAPGTSPSAQLGQLLEDNHELGLAREEAEWLRLKASRAAAERMPDPTIALRSTRERGGQERTYGVMLSFALPGSARSAEGAAARLRADMALERSAQVKARVELAAQQAVDEKDASLRIWKSLTAAAERSRQQAELMGKAYRNGECPIGEALLSRRQALDAALAAQTARLDALAAQARVQLDSHVLWSYD